MWLPRLILLALVVRTTSSTGSSPEPIVVTYCTDSLDGETLAFPSGSPFISHVCLAKFLIFDTTPTPICLVFDLAKRMRASCRRAGTCTLGSNKCNLRAAVAECVDIAPPVVSKAPPPTQCLEISKCFTTVFCFAVRHLLTVWNPLVEAWRRERHHQRHHCDQYCHSNGRVFRVAMQREQLWGEQRVG